MKKVYDTANFYHFIHTVALLAVPLSRKPVLVSTYWFSQSPCILRKRRCELRMARETQAKYWNLVNHQSGLKLSLRLSCRLGFERDIPRFPPSFLDGDTDGERDDGLLRDDLLPRAHRGEVAEEVHALRRHAPHRGLAQHGRVMETACSYVFWSDLVAYLSSDGLVMELHSSRGSHALFETF